MDVFKRSGSGSSVTDGDHVAHYGHNAAGWRTRADYDSDGNGTIDSGDTREYYQYDEQWRLTGIYRTSVPTGPGDPPDPDLACAEGTNPCLYQVYGYPPSGRTGGGGFPVAMGNPDTANSRWRDTDCDNALDERLDIYADSGGNIRGMMAPALDKEGQPSGGIGLTLERYDYTPFGRPIAQPLADINGDGRVDDNDLNAVDAAALAYAASPANYDPRADLDHDGDVDGADHDIAKLTPRVGTGDLGGYKDGKDHLSYGDGFNGNVGLDMRIGYRGYVWDPKLGMYHVRNRVYDPVAQRFIQPDPIGDAGGDHNWYRYVNNQPWAGFDPMGLERSFLDGVRVLFAVGTPLGQWVDPEAARWARDGVAEGWDMGTGMKDAQDAKFGTNISMSVIYCQRESKKWVESGKMTSTEAKCFCNNMANENAAAMRALKGIRDGEWTDVRNTGRDALAAAATLLIPGGFWAQAIGSGLVDMGLEYAFNPNATAADLLRAFGNGAAMGGAGQLLGWILRPLAQVARNRIAGNAARDAIAAARPGSVIEEGFDVLGGRRVVDVFDPLGIAIESKVGRTSLTPEVRQQIARDIRLIRTGQVSAVEWHFTRSAQTGLVGPTRPLRDKLTQHGIPIVVYP